MSTAVVSAPLEPGIVERQLDRVLNSSQFAAKTRLSRFLRYLVDQALAGNTEALKGYSIGLDVFDKPDDFDPPIDTIVRVQASKLRSRLDLYYATDAPATRCASSYRRALTFRCFRLLSARTVPPTQPIPRSTG